MADIGGEPKPKISDLEHDLEVQAFNEFQKADYPSCLQTLHKLQKSQESNPKVIHNRAVAEFYISDLRRYDQFRKTMAQITELVGEIQSVDVKHPELAAAYVNQAMVLYHFKQPLAALKIMLAVMNHFDQLDDYLLRKAGIFTVHLLLDTNQPRKANGLLGMLQARLNIRVQEILNSDDEDERPVDNESRKDISEIQFEEFRKEFRLILIRSNLLNGKKNFLIPGEDTSEYSVLKGHQYYLGNDYQMAAKELSKRFVNDPIQVQVHGEDQNTCLANNMGLIHFAVKHYALAARFFQQALLFDQAATNKSSTEKVEGSPLYCVGATKRPEIFYNHGITLLYLQRPSEAFECLLVVLNSYHNNPRLWLRLAECCIMVHQQDQKEQNKNPLTVFLRRKYFQKRPFNSEEQSTAIPSTTLEFASLCLRNAVTLIEYHTRELAKQTEMSDKPVSWDKLYEGAPCNPCKPLKPANLEKLRIATFSAYSYVLLSLGEFTLALKYAQQMLAINELPETYHTLGSLYSAEALVMLNRIPEALVYLDPKRMKDFTGEDFSTRGSPNWSMNSLEAAQSVMHYNLAVTLFSLGDYEKAKAYMNACSHPAVLPYLKMLKMYCELVLGNVEKAKLMARYDMPHLV
ncbi:CCR4-NOT transcription complex subunit 10 [Topomyia yanbarensis]|uniref:CCR4-NOT transcription complex subunit 10 n=1 Tax=Topomyia yanbarensis TaxID=2498891 RepID=UPI00273CE169|nr:CCR4-NOT transcription complex subunit 10 [Topomyia yanbarensis]